MVQETPSSDDSGMPVDPMRLVLALWRRRRAIAGAAVVGTAVGAIVAKTLIPSVFEARSVLECDRCSGPDFGDRELATLQESVKLPQHLEIARQKLRLEATLEQLGRDVDVNASIESRLIQVTARGKNGLDAAGLANAVVEAFVYTRLQIERDKLDGRVRTLEADAEKARVAILDARLQYDRFRTEHGIGDLPAERQAAIQEAARLRSEAAMARAEEQAEQARELALRRASRKEPATTILQQIEDLPDARRLAQTKAELAAARARLSDEHPRVQALLAEVEALEKRMEDADKPVPTGRTVGRNPQWESAQQGILQASAGQEAASMRQSAYEKLAQSAAQAAARLSKIEGEASELLANLQNAERHSANIDLDLKTARDAARTPSTGLRIIAEARAPTTPIKSSRRVVAILGPLLGCILALLVVLLREMRGMRIHTATELSFWGKGPVIAASPWPGRKETLDDLATDLLGPGQWSNGKTVMLGISAVETGHLESLKETIDERLPDEAPSGTAFDWPSDVETESARAPALRRVVRDADRVLVFVTAGAHSAFALRSFVAKLGCPGRIGFVLLEVRDDHADLPDQAGDASRFWIVRRSTAIRTAGRESGRRRGKPAVMRSSRH